MVESKAATNQKCVTPMRRRGSADLAATEDHLGLDNYATGIAKFIKECATPMTLSIQGDWGSGKTSLFNLIEAKLKNDSGEYDADIINVVKINTWQFSIAGYQEALISVLLTEIIDAISSRNENAGDDATSKRRMRMRSVVNALGNAASGHFFNMRAEELIRDISADNRQLPDAQLELAYERQRAKCAEIKQLKDDLREEIQKRGDASENPDKRLIVFIDDLDRLEPSCAVSLMEGIKNFMDCEGCVFILAIDEKVVFEGIKQKYGNDLGNERKQVFFDKLIQVPFHIPTTAYKVDEYVEDLLRDEATSETKDNFNRVIQALLDRQNPRSIKRYFNLTKLYESIFRMEGDGKQQSPAMLLAAIILNERSRAGDDDASRAIALIRDSEGLSDEAEGSETGEAIKSIVQDDRELSGDLKHWLNELQRITPQLPAKSLEKHFDIIRDLAAIDYDLDSKDDANMPTAQEFYYAGNKVLKINLRNEKQLTVTFYKNSQRKDQWNEFVGSIRHDYNGRFRYTQERDSHATLIILADDDIRKITDAVEDYLLRVVGVEW